jgi:hypothetical protein
VAKLDIYNDTLNLLGFSSLALITDDVEPRYSMDAVFESSVKRLYEEHDWNFATKTEILSKNAVYSEGGASEHPFWKYGFDKPSGWAKTIKVGRLGCEAKYLDEGGKLYGNEETLYLIYVNLPTIDDALTATWPEYFKSALSYLMAWKSANRLNSSLSAAQNFRAGYIKELKEAQSEDSANSDVIRPRLTSLVATRSGGFMGRINREND